MYDGCGDFKKESFWCMCVPLGANKGGKSSESDDKANVMRVLVAKSNIHFRETLVEAGKAPA